MIREYKESCAQSAQFIENWKAIDRNELCRLYVKNKDNSVLADSYLSAILYKFWNVTEHNYFTQKYKIATEADCIDWTVEGVLYALDHHVWDDPNNSLFEDPKGPEKAINVSIYSTKLNFYQRIKHQKEKISYESISLEQLMENASDSYYTPVYDKDTFTDSYISNLIKESFDKKDYMKAFVLDGIVNTNVFETVVEDNRAYTVFDDKKLRKHLRKLDSNYCKVFSSRYNIDFEDVLDSTRYITSLDYSRLFIKVNNLFKTLRRDKALISYLME